MDYNKEISDFNSKLNNLAVSTINLALENALAPCQKWLSFWFPVPKQLMLGSEYDNTKLKVLRDDLLSDDLSFLPADYNIQGILIDGDEVYYVTDGAEVEDSYKETLISILKEVPDVSCEFLKDAADKIFTESEGNIDEFYIKLFMSDICIFDLLRTSLCLNSEAEHKISVIPFMQDMYYISDFKDLVNKEDFAYYSCYPGDDTYFEHYWSGKKLCSPCIGWNGGEFLVIEP